ncbi:hypothetical protein K3G63_10895 [Hymenobacter sp. HSC-4F20]|uniref:hypothetical protein n=1 Tax=Hymenobacter sp. HSC-4F20 TaxID=2864135 RepID=UPI001C7370F4|nr:hypothetical protein [Hymenobacter sp. HSC-4F20]MBX0290949.1 hypothetical protein [Hymenobacter sp. HSC-4F20]
MFSFSNFYKPAPATVQRWAAALKGVGALIAASVLAANEKYAWLPWLGLVLAAVGEGLEKLSAAPPPAAGPDPTTDVTMPA